METLRLTKRDIMEMGTGFCPLIVATRDFSSPMPAEGQDVEMKTLTENETKRRVEMDHSYARKSPEAALYVGRPSKANLWVSKKSNINLCPAGRPRGFEKPNSDCTFNLSTGYTFEILEDGNLELEPEDFVDPATAVFDILNVQPQQHCGQEDVQVEPKSNPTVGDEDMNRRVDEAIAALENTSQVEDTHLGAVNEIVDSTSSANLGSLDIEMIDESVGTSQLQFADASSEMSQSFISSPMISVAVGNSQPMELMDVSTGTSQPMLQESATMTSQSRTTYPEVLPSTSSIRLSIYSNTNEFSQPSYSRSVSDRATEGNIRKRQGVLEDISSPMNALSNSSVAVKYLRSTNESSISTYQNDRLPSSPENNENAGPNYLHSSSTVVGTGGIKLRVGLSRRKRVAPLHFTRPLA